MNYTRDELVLSIPSVVVATTFNLLQNLPPYKRARHLFQDMDLIEVLWKQDVDLGFTLVEPATTAKKASTSEKGTDDEIEKLKALEAINASNEKVRNH